MESPLRMLAVIAAAESCSTDSLTRTILIVDDDRSVTDTFARMLKLEGFTVATAHTGCRIPSVSIGLKASVSGRPR